MIISATKLLTFHTYTEAQYAAHQVRPFRRSVDIHPRWVEVDHRSRAPGLGRERRDGAGGTRATRGGRLWG